MKYHTRKHPVADCPQADSREIAPGDLVYVPQRPRRCISALEVGTPAALRTCEFTAADRPWIDKLIREART